MTPRRQLALMFFVFLCFFSGVSRSCNLFTLFTSASSTEARREDARLALGQKEYPAACALIVELQSEGTDVSDLRKSLADSLTMGLFSNEAFLAAATGSGGSSDPTQLLSAMSSVGSSAACTDANCSALTDSCTRIIEDSSFSAVLGSIPGLKCAMAQLACSPMKSYIGVESDAGLSQVVKCKQKLKDSETDCPVFAGTQVGGPCNETIQLADQLANHPLIAPPCTSDLCTLSGITDTEAACTGGTLNKTNYKYDSTFLFFTAEVPAAVTQ